MAIKWVDLQLLFFDAQTTGIRPPAGQLLEVAWAAASANVNPSPEPIAPSSDHPISITSSVLQMPEGHTVSKRIRDLTGIGEVELTSALASAHVRDQFLRDVSRLSESTERPLMAIHYAQFEKPFLHHWLLNSEIADAEEQSSDSLAPGKLLPFDIICTHQIVKKLHPSLPSRNLRAVAGFFGDRLKELKRAGPHVATTISIWRSLAPELDKLALFTYDDLQAWLKEKPKSKKKTSVGYEYRIEKLTRLALPDQPGIYRMRAKDGEILYVGKATSLKSRVNSYFRGKKGREPRKLELMAQVWELDVTVCATPLEAALLETGEIKQWNPPYNVVLKEAGRTLIYYSLDLKSESPLQSESHPLGPFRRFGAIDNLRLLNTWILTDEPLPIFYEPFEDQILREAFLVFCERYDLDPQELGSSRKLIALGIWLRRTKAQASDPAAEPETIAQPSTAFETTDDFDLAAESDASSDAEGESDTGDLTIEEMADKFERLLIRAADTYLRAKKLTQLLNARVSWKLKNGWHTLVTCNAQILHEGDCHPQSPKPDFAWQQLAIADYDRMSVLLSELDKHEHVIEPAREPRSADSSKSIAPESIVDSF